MINMKNGIINRIMSFLSYKEGGRRLAFLLLIIGVVLAFVIVFFLTTKKYDNSQALTKETIKESTTSEMFPWEDEVIDGQDVDITGKWFEPHGGDHNIVFDADSSFIYHTFTFRSDRTYERIIIKGKYQRDGIQINLSGDDGWESIMYLRNNGTNYFLSDSIKTSGLYLVHSSE